MLERAFARGVLRLPPRVLRALAGPAVCSPEGWPLDLQTQAMLRMAALARFPELHVGGPAQARARADRAAPLLDLIAPNRIRAREAAAGEIAVRIYEPEELARPAPTIVYLHGGGWVLGSLGGYDRICRALAHRVGAVVVSVDYRRAPEHHFPAAVDDAVAAARWTLASAEQLGGDPARVAIAGDSAGGNLTAVVAQVTRHDARRPCFQLMMAYPATDLTWRHPSHAHFASGFFLTKASIDCFRGLYLSDPSEALDPRASPLRAEDLRGLPPACVMTAGFDPLRDEGRAYAARMREAGVQVDDRCYRGLVHGFLSMTGGLDAAAAAMTDAVNALIRGCGYLTDSWSCR
jgi:acetyl esterase